MTIGLDIGYDAIRLVALEQTSTEGHILNRVGEQPLSRRYAPQELLAAGEEVTEAVRAVMDAAGDPDWPVVMGVPDRFATVIRSDLDKSMTAKTGYAWMQWEADNAVPDSIDQYCVDVALTGHETDTAREAFIVAVRNAALDTLTQCCQEAGVYPVEVNVAGMASINAFEVTHPLSDWETAGLLHLEPGAADLILLRGSSFHVATLPLEDETQSLQSLGTRIGQWIEDGVFEEAPGTLFVSGSHPDRAALCARWSEQLDRPVVPAAPFDNLETNPALEAHLGTFDAASFMAAIGLALQVDEAYLVRASPW